jgi:S1-C subfamily serine protease
MKQIILLLLVISAFAGCSTYQTRISIVKYLPPIKDDSPVMIYFYDQKLPDSSEYIGDILEYIQPGSFGGAPANSLYEEIESEVKGYGGNAIKIDKNNEEKSRLDLFTGKVYKTKPFERVSINLDSLKKYWKTGDTNTFEGIYENEMDYIDEKYKNNWLKYACLKRDENYLLVYLSGFEVVKPAKTRLINLNRVWRKGDVFAYLTRTDNKNLFKTTLYSSNKCPYNEALVKFVNGNLRVYFKNGFDNFRKVYPDSSKVEKLKGSLTGFAVNSNSIITCYHGVSDNNIKIYVKGINKDFDKRYEAVVDKYDKVNDIATIKLLDTNIVLNNNPFFLGEDEKGIAEEVFTLGYPLSVLMGDDIKLTNGIISSVSGFAGDVSVYQVTAAVQPGSSGAPLFDKRGNLIGMINSKLMEAENVTYALKSKGLKEFLSKNGNDKNFKTQNDLSGKSLAGQVKFLQNSIYLIEIVDVSK